MSKKDKSKVEAGVESQVVGSEVIEGAQTEAEKVILASKAQATKRAQEGYTYAQERGFDVAEKAAQNESVGQFTNMGIGLGAMAGVGGALGGFMSNSMSDAMGSMNAPLSMPQAQETNAPVDEMAAFKAKVDKLTIMKNSGLISAEEFESLKKQLLATIL